MTTRERQDRLVSLLVRDGGWMTAARLADALAVTPRSVRTYVSALNARVAGDSVAVESGPRGYRAGPAAPEAVSAVTDVEGTPAGRVHGLVRRLLAEPDGLDVYETADRLHVSSATVEADLARVRGLVESMGLTLRRRAERVRLEGSEAAQRRLVSRLVHDEMDAGAFDPRALRQALGAASPGGGVDGSFEQALREGLGELGYFINELGIADVLLHIAIAADRVAQGHALADAAPAPSGADAVADLVGRLVADRLGVALGAGDRTHLATLVLTRVVTPGPAGPSASAPVADPEVVRVVRDLVAGAAAEFLVDIDHEDFVRRLSLHVDNLRVRAREQAFSRNALTRSLKSSYPMVFDVAVWIAAGLREQLGIALPDDEIAYIAMHVGGRVERSRQGERLLRAVIVCPGYYELHELLRAAVDRSLGRLVEVVGVETRTDVDWASLHADLVLSTVAAPPGDDRVVRILPFLTDDDVERVQAAASRVRRGRRLARLRAELERYVEAAAFVPALPAEATQDDVIRQLGGLLVSRGVIDDDYVRRTIEREQLSSTAFTESLAVPHAMAMTATRTLIAVGIADPPLRWGDERVQVVAMVAFSEADREAFQTVFEQFVEVFSDPDAVHRIVRRAADVSSFLDEVVAVIDG